MRATGPSALSRGGALGVAVAAALSLLSACSILASLDGLSDGTTPPTPDDATGQERAPDDDAGGTPGATDATAEATADAGSWCASAQAADAAFCSDFDTPATSEGWVELTEASGSLTYDTTSARSAPRSLVANIAGGPVVPRAVLLAALPTPSTKGATLAFDIVIDALPPTGHMMIAELDMAVGTAAAHGVYVYANRTTTILSQYRPTDAGGTLAPLGTSSVLHPAGTWRRVEVAIDLTASPTTTLRVDGALVATYPLASSWRNAPVTIVIGTADVDDREQPHRARFDNVVLFR